MDFHPCRYAVHSAAFDLRGLGIDATLTLVNGLRIAPYAQSAENYIDINAILVSAIEVSAGYGRVGLEDFECE